MAVASLEAEVEFLAHKVRTVVRELGTDQPDAPIFTSFRAFSRDGFLANIVAKREGTTTTSAQYKAIMVLTHDNKSNKNEYRPGEWEERLDEYYEEAIKPKVVQQSRDPNCKHSEVSYVTVPFKGQRFDCKGCGYAERMPYAPGKVIIFPPNSIIDGTHRVDENGVVKRAA